MVLFIGMDTADWRATEEEEKMPIQKQTTGQIVKLNVENKSNEEVGSLDDNYKSGEEMYFSGCNAISRIDAQYLSTLPRPIANNTSLRIVPT